VRVAGAWIIATDLTAVNANNVPVTYALSKTATEIILRRNGVATALAAANVFAATTPGVDFGWTSAGNMHFAAYVPATPTAAEIAILERAAGICSGQVAS
jgi:hypothetical protein